MSSNHHQNILTDLHQLAASESRLLLSELMAGEGRDQLVFSLDDLSVDLTRQPVTPASLSALLQLADSAGLRQNIDDMMAGRPVNLTENRPAIHCQLRSPESKPYM